MELVSRFFAAPERSFFLFGPCGTGKTTWLRQALPGALWLNLLHPEEYRALKARPERLRELVLGAPPPQRDVVIDEVQRVPELLHVVHDLMESGPAKRYVLTGSSARKVRQAGVDLLGGRAVLRTLHPFMASEWSGFSLARALEWGLVPLVVASSSPDEVLRAYVGLYLEQEIRAEGIVRNLSDFARFLEAVSFSHAQVLNVSSVARDTGAHRKTVQGFLEVLEDLLLAFRVEVFTRRAKRETAAHPKLYLFDAGVFRSLRPAGPLDRPAEIDGAALEGLVAQHLRAWIAYSGSDLSLYTWRTRSGVEVDFVLYGPDGFFAVEVKNTSEVRPADLRGLAAFRDDYPESEGVLLYRGDRRMRKGEVPCLPVEEFLAALEPSGALLP
jgi:predicted AAA+ superfamily ATPase